MISISPDILAQYDAILGKRAISASQHPDYNKWLSIIWIAGESQSVPCFTSGTDC
jgi:hypothetical protein